MSDRRVSKRIIKGTSRCLATIRVASDSEAVPVPPVLAGPPTSGHGDPVNTLGSNASVEHNNNMESGVSIGLGTNKLSHGVDTVVQRADSDSYDHAADPPIGTSGHVRDSYSIVEQELERTRQERLERQRLENEMASEIERARQEQEQLERHNLEIEKTRELEKAWQEAEKLASQQRLAKMEQELQEVRERVSRLKAQQNSPFHPTTSHASISLKPNNSSLHPTVRHIPSERRPLGQSVREGSRPRIDNPNSNRLLQSEEDIFGTTAKGCGETPRTASIQLSHVLNQNNPLLKHIGIGELKREEEFITLKLEFFEDLCLERNVQTDQDRYKLLDKFVAWGDKQDYRNKFDRDHQNYHTLKEYLIGGEGRLSHVLFHRSEKHSVSGQELNVEIGKYMAEFRDVAILKKFVTIHLAPPRLRGKIREKLHLDVKKFDIAIRTIIDTASQETRTRAMNVNYTSQGAATNRNPIRPIQTHQHRPPINNYRNSNQGFLCHRHLNFGDRAYYCADPERCSMRHMIMGYPSKNGHPNSPQ